MSQAVSDGMLQELRLTHDDYSVGLTAYFVAAMVAELPSQLLAKRIGAHIWLPIQLIAGASLPACRPE